MNSLTWFLLALPLALDVFAAGLVFGLAGLERSRWVGIAFGFAAIGGTLMAVGILLGDVLEGTFGTVALYIAAAVLLVIGLRGISHGIQSGDGGTTTSLSTRKIAATALAIAVDKLAVGLSFAVLEAPLGTMVVIVAGQVFVATLLGLSLGKRLGTRAGDAAEIIAGFVFTGLGLAILYKAVTSRA
jgi:manganese efflux pump family protein